MQPNRQGIRKYTVSTWLCENGSTIGRSLLEEYFFPYNGQFRRPIRAYDVRFHFGTLRLSFAEARYTKFSLAYILNSSGVRTAVSHRMRTASSFRSFVLQLSDFRSQNEWLPAKYTPFLVNGRVRVFSRAHWSPQNTSGCIASATDLVETSRFRQNLRLFGPQPTHLSAVLNWAKDDLYGPFGDFVRIQPRDCFDWFPQTDWQLKVPQRVFLSVWEVVRNTFLALTCPNGHT